ncbi:2-methylaconitate cis-trans isomerase PrpF [Roseateles chitinivorans]|uniref:2-methylaconitate cis-trans isomerase PrpF n=1 Tax=Roseateles chitinivorans TaxID=2917965 RepID=A0A2G9C9A7_9BURK|nr:2-methylaconitate cis-trans isomerase PrpF [Roseateles chitinivorans]PIM53030.1 2-methylaconitate cis-trans isomerase PrpF [Roseateles chitinivorans]
MSFLPVLKIPAVLLRGGTSKGVFFRLEDLPADCRKPGAARDRLLLRVIGSPDAYGKQIDGLGGATSSTSKVVIASRSARPGHDVDYLFGQVAIDRALVDWSGNCGNLSAAVGPFAIETGLIDAATLPRDGQATVRIWQANIGKTIVARVPMQDGRVLESGDFELDGVTFPGAEIELAFLDPGDDGDGADARAGAGGQGEGAMFPTGRVVDELALPEDLVAAGRLRATLINAGIPTVFVDARALGYTGTEAQESVNGDAAALRRLEAIRAHAALRMGLIDALDEAATRPHTPKLAFVAPPQRYRASSGRIVEAGDIDMLVRALSMGRLHHAMMGTAAVAIGAAAAIPGTVVCEAAGGAPRASVRFGHPSGTLRVGAEAALVDGQWRVTRAVMSRSARVLMEGVVRVPAEILLPSKELP